MAIDISCISKPAAVDERGRGLYTAIVADPPSQPRPANWLIWQVIDSAFPVGGFAHSGGLEAAVQLGYVTSPDELTAFVRTALVQSANLSAPFVIAIVSNPSRFDGLNAQYDTLTINTVANASSRAQGAAILSAGEAILNDAAIIATRARLRAARGFAHLPHGFALLATAANMDATAAVDTYLYQQARSLFSAAVRLSIVGPMEAQRRLIEIGNERDALIAASFATSTDAAAQTAPMLDLLQSLHERLYSRLFVS